MEMQADALLISSFFINGFFSLSLSLKGNLLSIQIFTVQIKNIWHVTHLQTLWMEQRIEASISSQQCCSLSRVGFALIQMFKYYKNEIMEIIVTNSK